jgi:hypothetical protein
VKARSYEVDELLSWARCSGDTLIVHLRLPGAELAAGAAGVELVSTSGRIRSTAVVTVEDGVAEVLLDTPRRELGSSTWRLSIQAGRDAGSVPVEARLLAAPGSPVALLPGPAPSTRMRPPTRRPPRPLTLRLADELPTPLRRALGRARTKARTVVGHLRR